MAFDLSSIAEDMLDKLHQSICNLLINGIVKEFEIISDILSSTSDAITGSGTNRSVLSELVTASPADWNGTNGHGGGYGSIWGTVRAATEDIVVPIAGTLFALIMFIDFIRILLGKNEFTYDGSEIMRWFLKYYAGNELLAHAYDIAPWLLKIGTDLAGGVSANGFNQLNTAKLADTFSKYDSGQLLLMFLIVMIVILGVAALVVVMVASLCTRMIDAIIYMSVAPLATATFASDSWSSVGKSWAKGLVGVGVQGFFIIVAMIAEGAMLTSSLNLLKGGSSQLMFNLILLLGVTGGLTMTVAKSGQLSKQIFGA